MSFSVAGLLAFDMGLIKFVNGECDLTKLDKHTLTYNPDGSRTISLEKYEWLYGFIGSYDHNRISLQARIKMHDEAAHEIYRMYGIDEQSLTKNMIKYLTQDMKDQLDYFYRDDLTFGDLIKLWNTFNENTFEDIGGLVAHLETSGAIRYKW